MPVKKGLSFDDIVHGADIVPCTEDANFPRQFKRIPQYSENGKLVGFAQPMQNPRELPSEDEIIQTTTYDPTNPVNVARYARDLQAMTQAESFSGVVHDTAMDVADKVKAYVNGKNED